MSDEEDSSEENDISRDGYCHFNEDGSASSFSISLFGTNVAIVQNPASRLLGHGAVVWDAAVIFAKYMEHTPKDFSASKLAGAKVLELGSGCGLAGIAFMMKGTAVTFTDLPSVVEALTTQNAQKMYRQLITGGSTGSVLILPPVILPIDWTTFSLSVFGGGSDCTTAAECIPSDVSIVAAELEQIAIAKIASESETVFNGVHMSNLGTTTEQAPMTECAGSPYQPPFDIILLTDCVFSVLLVQPLISTILACCNSHTEVICCHEIRDEEANAYFVEELKKHFVVKRIPRAKLHPDYRNNLVEVLSAKLIRSSKKKSGASI